MDLLTGLRFALQNVSSTGLRFALQNISSTITDLLQLLFSAMAVATNRDHSATIDQLG